jgi:tRNA (guanine37-N1)-methyltransferase
VPDVLLSGHHGKIQEWRRAEAERITRERRPDLWSSRPGGEPVAQGQPSGD